MEIRVRVSDSWPFSHRWTGDTEDLRRLQCRVCTKVVVCRLRGVKDDVFSVFQGGRRAFGMRTLFVHFITHTNTHKHGSSVTFHLRQAAAFNVSSGKRGVSVIAYISLSLVEISTAVSVFTVKALPVALLLSLPANESVALCRISGFCFSRRRRKKKAPTRLEAKIISHVARCVFKAPTIHRVALELGFHCDPVLSFS